MGYHLHSGGKWSGDYLVMDTATYAKHPDGRHCHVHRVKDIAIQDGRWAFPVKEGILRHHNPEARDQIRHDTARPLGDTTGDSIHLYPPEWDDPSIHDGRLDSPQLPEAAEPAAEAPAADYWELRGDTIIRHIMTPRTQLFRPTDNLDGIPVPVDTIDVTR